MGNKRLMAQGGLYHRICNVWLRSFDEKGLCFGKNPRMSLM